MKFAATALAILSFIAMFVSAIIYVSNSQVAALYSTVVSSVLFWLGIFVKMRIEVLSGPKS